MTVSRQPLPRRFIPALVASVLFLLFALLWLAHFTKTYRHILTIWGVDVFDFPFADTETVLSGARCLRAGIDIYVSNPCDTLGRVYDYSPLWMLMGSLPVTLAWGVPCGLLVVLLYLIAVALLPVARTGRHALAITLGAVSSTAAFAVERGNNDLVLFALAAFAATLACRSPLLRLLGYGCALLAGLLKYYPMVLMALATRERRPRLVAISLAAILVTASFAVLAWHDLTRALQLVPVGSHFEGMFGSVQTAGGLGIILSLPDLFIPMIRWGMTIAAFATGAWIAGRPSTLAALQMLSMPERAFLLAGGLLTLGCFFTAQNIGYRAIHLVLTLPGLLALRHSTTRVLRPAALLALALLWSDFWRRGLRYATKSAGPQARHIVDLIGWGMRECLWWWLISLLAGCVIALLWRSTLTERRPILWA